MRSTLLNFGTFDFWRMEIVFSVLQRQGTVLLDVSIVLLGFGDGAARRSSSARWTLRFISVFGIRKSWILHVF